MTLDPATPERPTTRLTSVPVDPLSSHIASMLRRLDDEVTRVREDAEADAERIVEDARVKAERIIGDAERQAAEAEQRRDAMLEQRARIVHELRRIRDTIVGMAGRFEQERPDVGRQPTARSGELPPPPRRRGVLEHQEPLWAERPGSAEDDATRT